LGKQFAVKNLAESYLQECVMFVKKSILLLLAVTLTVILISACSSNAETILPTATADLSGSCSIGGVGDAQPALYGLWVKEEDSNKGTARELLTITEKSVYLVESANGTSQGGLRETFYEITSVDWKTGVVTMLAKWVRLNGIYGGFDYPLRYMKATIDGENLYFSLGDEGQGIPTETTNGPWVRN
jgi:hypothetical protein